jgi:hypothetical protein
MQGALGMAIMGTLNSQNYVYMETGINYRKAARGIRKQMEIAKNSGDPDAAKAYDLLLAKLSFLSATLLSNDTRLHDLNLDCMENLHLAIDRKRYNVFFDYFINKYAR